MVMDTLQIRLSHGLVEKIDKLVETGIYSNRSDVVRDAVRRLVLDQMTGIIANDGDSVTQVKKARKKLSKEIKSYKDLEKINALAD